MFRHYQLPDLVSNTPLLKVLNVDKLNYNNDPQEGGDGFFDFIPGLTVDTQNGRIIFTTVEPFGNIYLKNCAATPEKVIMAVFIMPTRQNMYSEICTAKRNLQHCRTEIKTNFN